MTAYANDTQANESREAIKLELIEELVTQHGFDEQYITAIFEKVAYLPKIIDNISKPAEKTKHGMNTEVIFFYTCQNSGWCNICKTTRNVAIKSCP